MKIVKIRPRLFEEILLPAKDIPFAIEIVADDEIDCGVMSDASYRQFAESDSEKGIQKERWFEQTRKAKFIFTPSKGDDYWVILWNAYSDNTVTVAYNIALEE